MSDWESICADAHYEEEQEKLRLEYFPDDDDIEEKYDEILSRKQWETITYLYGVENYYDNLESWNILDEHAKIEYCKVFLNPLAEDSFPLQRQVFILVNLVNLNILESPLYEIMDATLYEHLNVDSFSLQVNCLIPKKHYKSYVDRLYADSDVKSLQIPVENSTAYLQELLEIWYMYKSDLSPYEISKDLIPYDSLSYEPKQIERKLIAIRRLLS